MFIEDEFADLCPDVVPAVMYRVDAQPQVAQGNVVGVEARGVACGRRPAAVVEGAAFQCELLPAVGLPAQVGLRLVYADAAYAGIQPQAVERHVQSYGDVCQLERVQLDFPVQRGCGGGVFGRRRKGVGQKNLHVGVGQFHAVQHHGFLFQVQPVAFQKEASQRTLYLHAGQQARRVDRHLFEGDAVHLHLSAEQRQGLYADIQAAQPQQRVGRLDVRGKAVGRLYHLHAAHQQVERETQVYALHGYLHARGLGS